METEKEEEERKKLELDDLQFLQCHDETLGPLFRVHLCRLKYFCFVGMANSYEKMPT